MTISHLTPAEQWRLTGSFTEATAHGLLDLAAVADELGPKWATDALDEVRGCLPQEDVLTAVLRDLALLVKSCRGSNKDKAQEIFNDLHQVMENLRLNADHAAEELESVQDKLAGMRALN